MRAWKWIATIVAAALSAGGCHNAKRADRPVVCQEFAVPPADDDRFLNPSVAPDKKTALVPYQRPNAPQGLGGPGGPGGGGAAGSMAGRR